MIENSRPAIHWVSPLPPAETDIGHYSVRILEELTERADVVLWTDANSWDRSLEKLCPVRKLDPDRANPADFASQHGTMHTDEAIFTHIGNSWVFHSGLLRFAQRLPSIIVLHDLAIQELCRDAILNGLFDKGLYTAEMRRWYGARGAALAEGFLNGQVAAYDISSAAPGFEVALGRAVAVLTHTSTAFDAVKARGHLPCYQLNLPFKAKPSARSRRDRTGPLKFVQFGYIGPNRRLEQVLDALSEVPEGIDFTFDIAGNVWDPDHIGKHIHKLGLQNRVRLHGFIAEDRLDEMLAEAHLVFNLRHPTMGEASGSQLRIWNAAAASVVTNQGWYGTFPKDAAFRISVGDEKRHLLALIQDIARDRGIGEAVGETGRGHLLEWHGPALYADEIISVARRFKADARLGLLADVARQAVSASAARQDLIAQTLSRQIA